MGQAEIVVFGERTRRSTAWFSGLVITYRGIVRPCRRDRARIFSAMDLEQRSRRRHGADLVGALGPVEPEAGPLPPGHEDHADLAREPGRRARRVSAARDGGPRARRRSGGGGSRLTGRTCSGFVGGDSASSAKTRRLDQVVQDDRSRPPGVSRPKAFAPVVRRTRSQKRSKWPWPCCRQEGGQSGVGGHGAGSAPRRGGGSGSRSSGRGHRRPGPRRGASETLGRSSWSKSCEMMREDTSRRGLQAGHHLQRLLQVVSGSGCGLCIAGRPG